VDRRTRDTDTARAVIDAARTEAASERAAAALSTRHAGEAELDSVREAARREAEEILRRAADRTPHYVERVLELVRAVGEMPSAGSQGGS
jgi:vacuolar-type H+-ATPase subunit H